MTGLKVKSEGKSLMIARTCHYLMNYTISQSANKSQIIGSEDCISKNSWINFKNRKISSFSSCKLGSKKNVNSMKRRKTKSFKCKNEFLSLIVKTILKENCKSKWTVFYKKTHTNGQILFRESLCFGTKTTRN